MVAMQFGGETMSKLKEAERLISELLPGERASILQTVANDFGNASAGIESTPGVCGGEPCIVRTRIPVWLLEQARHLGTQESDLLRSYPTLLAADLVNVWAYVRGHRGEIDRQIR